MSSAAELFNYNRENFKFNKELRQKRLHMEQNMRIRQVLLFRQDLKDLFDLTIGKMDSYMMVNVLLLGITAEMYFKGRAPLDVPGWLFWFWGISLAGAFFFLLYSTWLALHASVHAQTYMARCLTQWLRLPVPSIEEINTASARLEEYEKSDLLDFVRPPVVVPEATDSNPQNFQKDLSTHWTEFSDHFVLFNKLHTKWQSHEAYARVSMCFGTNMLLSAFAYFALAYYSIDYEDPWIGSLFVVLAVLAQLIHLRMSLSLSEREHFAQIILVMVPPVCVAVAAALSCSVDEVTGVVHVPTSATILACVANGFQFLWILFFLYQTYHDEDGLPVKFSTVWCLEILGQGIETIRDIEEPRVDFPGFIQPSTDPTDRPLNTYDASHSGEAHGRKKSSLESTTMPSDVMESCKALESQLQRLFGYWAKQGHELDPDDLEHIDELKAAFEADSATLSKNLRATRKQRDSILKTGASQTGGDAQLDSNSHWVRLTFDSDDGRLAPYLLNPETGEIKWEDQATDDLRMDINRGISLLPEQMEKFHESVRKIEYASRRDKAMKRQSKQKPPKWPWELFRTGGVIILISWLAALTETILDKLGIEPTFTPLVN